MRAPEAGGRRIGDKKTGHSDASFDASGLAGASESKFTLVPMTISARFEASCHRNHHFLDFS
jgi:hypothetical protein